MADKPKDETPKKDLSDEIVQRVRAEMIHGTGYGKPPKEHQFKKGQRANPNGRPRKAAPELKLDEQPLLSSIHKVLKEPVKARDGDKIVEMPTDEALARAGVNFAFKGNARFYGIVMDAGRQAQEAHAREVRERNDVWGRYQAMAREVIAEAKARGEPEPELLPHPDDIVIDWENGPRFIGPFDEESAAQTKKTMAFRDALIWQAALDEKLNTVDEGGDRLDGPGTAYQFAILMNQTLPPRLRLSEDVIFCQVDRYARHPRRWLLKEVRASWWKQGVRLKRGLLFPPLRWAVQKIDMISDFLAALKDGRLDADCIADGDLDDLVAFFRGHGYPG